MGAIPFLCDDVITGYATGRHSMNSKASTTLVIVFRAWFLDPRRKKPRSTNAVPSIFILFNQ
jgi:hypothetical protein